MEAVEPDTSTSVWMALGVTGVLAGLHLAAPRIRTLPLVPEHYMGSFAGGLAVAYVFLHLLPEIAAGNEAVGEALSDVPEPTPLLELAIFLVALTGFTAFYGLERLAAAHGQREVATSIRLKQPGRKGANQPGFTCYIWGRSWSTTH